MRAGIHARDGSEFTIADFGAMPYTTAVITDVSRYITVAVWLAEATSFRFLNRSPPRSHPRSARSSRDVRRGVYRCAQSVGRCRPLVYR
ncbi:hypothetical protein BDN67DRAFT_61244 [Paxillus ammoniavirescens]|nr:hypothetical protein BDN67DRAFT_61244 [Paxillus ammoniavirescens]